MKVEDNEMKVEDNDYLVTRKSEINKDSSMAMDKVGYPVKYDSDEEVKS
jgi:hypothetical protein